MYWSAFEDAKARTLLTNWKSNALSDLNGMRLTEAFGAAGLMLAAREEQDRAKVVEEGRRLASAIKDFA